MTNITIFEDYNLISGFKFEGHSEYSTKGYDIVCSAISALSQGILNGIVNVVGAKCCSIDTNEADGYLCFILERDGAGLVVAQVLLRTLKLALEDLQEQYPKYITIDTLKLEVQQC